MRKALIAFILIFALMIAGGVYTMHDAALPRDEVVVSEILRRGDTSAAEGLSLAMHTNFDDHLFWDVDYTPGQAENTKTDYRVSAKKDYGEYMYEPLAVNLAVEYDSVYMSNIDEIVDPNNESLEGIAKAYWELWMETPNGGEGVKLIHLKDYYDYYPIGGSVEVAGVEVSFDTWALEHEESFPMAKAAHKAINEYFCIPVLENDTEYISLRKDDVGNINGRGSGSGNSDNFYLWSDALILPDAVYFTINNRSSEGKLVDTSLIPGGYGIYRLPYTMENGEGKIQFDELSTVKSLDEEFDVGFMFRDEPMEKIILIGVIREETRMLVIDAESMETLQDILISDECDGCWQYYDGGDFIVMGLGDGSLALVERQENGEYLLRFVIEDEAHGELYYRYDAKAWAWNGEKLAVSGYKDLDDMDERYVADFYYAVYDKTGLLCFTDCDSSLCVNEDQQWGCVRGNDAESMELEWN